MNSLPAMICANSCFLLCRFCAHGDKLPGDLCGVKSDQTRDTCWSRMSWSVSSSSSISLALNASANIFPPPFADCSTCGLEHNENSWDLSDVLDFVLNSPQVIYCEEFHSLLVLWRRLRALESRHLETLLLIRPEIWGRFVGYEELSVEILFMGWEMKKMC